jgi:hypothetical protein
VRKSPTVRSGLVWACGSWKIIAAWLARYARSWDGDIRNTSRPTKRTEPSTLAPRGSRRRTVRAVIDFPEPDSPTSPTDSPAAIDRSTRRITSRSPPSSGTLTRRPSISSRALTGDARGARGR